MKRALAGMMAATVLLGGCAVGPNYKRPQVALPQQFRGAAAGEMTSLGDTKWQELFGDPEITRVVNLALEKNFDLRIATQRVEEARAQLGVTRANQFPFLSAQGGFTASRGSSLASPFVRPGTNLSVAFTSVGAALSWEVDLWGRLRRLTEAARAQYLASEEGKRAVRVSLVAEVMTAYLQLLERDLELEISRRTSGVADEGIRLVGLRRGRGAASGLDLRQAEQLRYIADSALAGIERDIAQTENALSLLEGDVPALQQRGRKLEEIAVPTALPAGSPAAMLSRRPDIRQAEANLMAANAQIGAARALYYPQISLSAFAGGQSKRLLDLATSPAKVYTAAPSALQTIFNAGQVRNQVRFTEAQQRELLINYQRTIYTALREISDSLVGADRTRAQREQQENLVKTLAESVRLSELRYRGGLDSYLQVLDAQRNLFSAEIGLAQLRLQERLTVVQLYRALGGGWV